MGIAVTQTIFKRTRSLLIMGAHVKKSVDLAGFLKIRFFKRADFNPINKIVFFLEILKWPDFRVQESRISVP